MPIEFRCQQCGKLLRVGDETAGKQAKCPSCGSVQTIPAATPAPEMPSPPPMARPVGNPFGTGPLAPSAAPDGEQNPYQSPPSYATHDLYGPPGSKTATAYRPTLIHIGDVLTQSWEIYKDQLWICIGVVVLCGIINYAVGFAGNIVNFGMGAVQAPAWAAFTVNIVMTMMQVAFQLWLSLGQTMFFLKVVRGETASVGIIFEGTPYLVRAIVATLILALGGIAIVAVCAIPAVGVYLAKKDAALGSITFIALFFIPAIYIALTFYQYLYLIVDHNLGAIDSLLGSRDITRGNRLSIFLMGLIGFLLNLLGIIACCVGALFTASYIVLCMTVMYLLMSGGQTVAAMRR